MADWANILGGILSGGADQLGNIQQQRLQQAEAQRRDQLLQLQQRQQAEMEKKNATDLFMKKLEAIPTDADVDADTLKQAATLGLAPMFRKDPTSGGFRRIPSISERADLLTVEANTIDLDRTRRAMSPQAMQELMGLPLAERQIRTFQLFGPQADVPMNPEEQLDAAKRNPAYMASVADNQTALQVANINRQTSLLSNQQRLSPEVIAMIDANPNALRDMSPSQRGQVMMAYANTTGKTLPQAGNDSAASMAAQGKMLITKMLGSENFSAGVGAPDLDLTDSKGNWQLPDVGGVAHGLGLTESAMPGSRRATFLTDLNQFKGIMTVPQLQHMRGLGHMSEREFATMERIGTNVSENSDEEAARQNLQTAYRILEAVEERARRGIKVNDQSDIFTELERDLQQQAPAGGPSYRRVGTTVYKDR